MCFINNFKCNILIRKHTNNESLFIYIAFKGSLTIEMYNCLFGVTYIVFHDSATSTIL